MKEVRRMSTVSEGVGIKVQESGGEMVIDGIGSWKDREEERRFR